MLRAALLSPIVGCGLLLLTAGCATLQPNRDAAVTIDSLQTANAALADSIRFYDDIASGRYYRELRVRQDHIQQLEYALATCRDGGQIVMTFLADSLFAPASARLTEAGTERLARWADELRTAYANQPIRVEGHSDNVAIGPNLADTYPSNWELAAARAAAVVRHFIDVHELDEDRFIVASRAATEPVAPNTSERGRSLNRRIRITALPDR